MSVVKDALCLLALWGILGQTVNAETKIHFTGRLLSSPCSLVVNGNTLTEVLFPSLSAPELATRGRSKPVAFSLQLKDCNTVTSKSVSVRFSGMEVSGMSGFLALEGGADASGIGIGIETEDGAQVKINGASGNEFMLSDGLNTLNFNAWIQAVEGQEITPGTFSATTLVAFEYL
ncbi:Fimbrial protein [Citrobacter sedlakii]|uniref:fimbrial protein n=1 Tax=Citrobacter sedlakii TaxID=67826 RepID=UPI001BA52096|nr:fimbrial protein [Citrobacter sedlakii]EKJ8220210.1 fimbrial protein [Citrobacter sedlakii]MEB0952377.1 fimbrial protein [Citrobacter sedlakii]QUC30708.1 fimbrial protein [Citrobacter sedlakii]HCT5821991.1 fimbrial protein [Citrobacter sedlakii]